MEEIMRAIAEAAYNGVCLAAENGQTEDYEVQDVGKPEVDNDELGGFVVTLKDGRTVTVQVTSL